jgi:trehalose 6-phosphate synthase
MNHSNLNQRELVIVANRLPVQRVKRNRIQRWELSSGGLVSALRSILRETPCTWVGWAGESEEIPPFEFDGIDHWPITLSKSEVQSFYEGFSNRILWPLYHDAIRPPEYRQSWWEPYANVNRRFAEAAANASTPDGVIWVHDYHLQLVPQMIRDLRADARIGFFLHIPFPPQELFAQLPWRKEILEGVLGADVIGFQTTIGAQNFRQVACRFAGATVTDGVLEFHGRTIHVGCYPISVDVEQFEVMARDPKIIAKSKELRGRIGQSRKIMLGIDRLDYTKGIDIRLQAFRELLRTRRVSADECVLVQIAVPSREHVTEYKELRVNVERLVGEIEGEFSEIGRNPVQYLHRTVSPEELVALYLAADVMLVTPLRDGMNLVAKEYVSSRTDNSGVLVLSEFTGAARELKSALLVNPHDIQGLVSRMERGLRMPLSEQMVRMKSMRAVVKGRNVHTWADSFMQSLASYART